MTGGKTPRSALEIATHAVVQLEDNPLFNAGRGAVFTRDGINELEASVMVSRGRKKRGVGVMGLRRVRNPILLAKAMLEHGDEDLEPGGSKSGRVKSEVGGGLGPDVPSAQGHTQLFGETAEELARAYGLELVSEEYFFTKTRWDEHIRSLNASKTTPGVSATWSAEEYLPQGTVGAVALDAEGVVCAATSTGGLTNKLTGRVGDTPVPGAGFWAEEWEEEGDPTDGFWGKMKAAVMDPGRAVVELSGPLRGVLADCLPSPFLYRPVAAAPRLVTMRSMATSGTGNGDSFLRTGAGRTVGAIARWKPEPSRQALSDVAGPGGILQQSAGDRFGRTGEGEGGMIGIEAVVVREDGRVLATRSEILMDFNCGGMYRAWVDDEGKLIMSAWTNHGPDTDVHEGSKSHVDC